MKLHTAAAWLAALFLASNLFSHTVSLRLLLLAAGIVLAAIVVLKNQEIRKLPPVWIPFVLWGAWAALSLAWSIEPDRTLKEWRNEVFYTGAALWVCFIGAQALQALRLFALVLAAAVVAACTVALVEFSRGWEGYSVGWHGGPGDHSSALLVGMPCVAMAAWYASRRQKTSMVFAASALAGLLFASAYTTLNRTVWLGLAVQFVALGSLLVLRARPMRVKVVAPALAAAVIAGCGVVILSIQADRQALGVARPLQHDARMLLWPQVAAHIAERPFAGYGFGRGMLRDPLQKEFKAYDTHLWHAHNLFLEALLQVGAPGLLLLLALLFAVAREAWRQAAVGDDLVAACGIALLGVVAGMVMRNMTDTLLVRQNALLFWGMVGVLLGIGGASSRRPTAATNVLA